MFFAKKNDDEDLEVYKVIFQSLSPKIYKIAYAITGNEYDAKDVVQDTFIQAFKNIKSLKDKSKFNNWVYSIASNLAKSRYNKNKREVASIIDEDLVHNFANHNNSFDDPDAIIEKKETSNSIKSLLNELSPTYKEVLILYYYADLSYEQISNDLNISMGTVKSRLYRAKEALKEKIQKLKAVNENIV